MTARRRLKAWTAPDARSARPWTRCAAGTLLFLVASVAMLGSFGAQAAPTWRARWDDRLAALDPVRPLDYLLLGEEIADTAASEEERQLALELFGLAGALDQDRLGRSAMLAIASSSAGMDRARALAAAEILGGMGLAREVERIDPKTVEALAKSFSHFRRGNGSAALGALQQADAGALLDRIGTAVPGGADAYRDDCKRMRKGGGLADWPLSRGLMLAELALRKGPARSMSLDMLLMGDEPLVEIDTEDPVALWGVDPKSPWWRKGRWTGRNEAR